MMATEYSAQIENFVRMNEADLVGAAQKGDLDAFNQIVLLYQSKIYSLTYRILGERGSAEDITQETFLAAYLNLSRFRNGSFQGWLYRIATNACYDLLRWHKRRPTLSLDWEDNSDIVS